MIFHFGGGRVDSSVAAPAESVAVEVPDVGSGVEAFIHSSLNRRHVSGAVSAVTGAGPLFRFRAMLQDQFSE
ncbi:hypothetical protein GCM10009755_19430 [Brevibacterium samyangense]|uniref:Uncharacterized protein n=1 Tax=Brevibacterium samyangense TaxID=366888 RepID=A0ABN2TH24_9MICO